MPTNLDGKAVTASVKNYERLLAIYPVRFRREYGQEMTQLFRDQCRDAWTGAGGWGLAAMWLRVLPDLAKTAFVEHFSNLRQREPVFLKMARALRSDPRPRAAFIRVFALVFIPAIMGSAMIAHWLPRVYSSTVRIEVGRETSDPFSAPYFLITQQKIIESYSVLTNVIVRLHLDRKLPEQLDLPQWTMDETYAHLSKMVTVNKNKKTDLFEVTVRNRSARLAAEIANCIADSYRNNRLDQWRQIRYAGIEARKSHLIADEVQLMESLKKLDEVRAKLGVPESDLQATNIATVSSTLRPYYMLKDEVENLRYNSRESRRNLDLEIFKSKSPTSGIVVVRDPGRINLKPVSPTWWTIIAWMIGGVLLALVTGAAAGCLAAATRRTPERPGAAP